MFFLGGKILQDGLPDMYERSYGAHLEVLHGLTKKTHRVYYVYLTKNFVVAPVFFSHFFVAWIFFGAHGLRLSGVLNEVATLLFFAGATGDAPKMADVH